MTSSATTDRTPAAIDISGVVKVFGQGQNCATALRNVSLTIRDNEFFTLLGPSGCGKTTLLRILAGFEAVTQGSVSLFGQNIAGLPANKRSVNTVFQHYALFPHMTVGENVAYGLRRLKRPTHEIEQTMARSLQLVKMEKFMQRRPAQLSGGQQQRVALARALAPHPKVLLLDEPLSALDLKLRQAMRTELKQLQKATGITFVFVTHDQEEALSMSDRIAVMSEGEVQQVGTPTEIYEHPVNKFVASFIGDANFIEAEIERVEDGVASCRTPRGRLLEARNGGDHKAGDRGTLFLRPEKVQIGGANGTGLPGTIRLVDYLGQSTFYHVDIGEDAPIMVEGRNKDNGAFTNKVGDAVSVHFGVDALRMLIK
ncbi:ABC transporter ATP-binding protein [Pseudaminobacter sp. NGMCC 1.201702]|uniref:ABC transporter ATP-binding protein n=1 Tax=Pseudaminobacter sp. NGMCC 1.201702 TaxID=3391825 RepID=UPI0039EF48B5